MTTLAVLCNNSVMLFVMCLIVHAGLLTLASGGATFSQLVFLDLEAVRTI